MEKEKVFVALGANLADKEATFKKALALLKSHPEIFDLQCSNFYCTTPVSSIEQPGFLNAVCCFDTTLSIENLWQFLQQIEKNLGKKEKRKEEPRIIDLDLLFYGKHKYNNNELFIPHLRWKERLFVLIPLRDLTPYILIENNKIDLDALISSFNNIHNEEVFALEEPDGKKNS